MSDITHIKITLRKSCIKNNNNLITCEVAQLLLLLRTKFTNELKTNLLAPFW